MSKLNKISGYPEWLPEHKLIEERFINSIRDTYIRYGFSPIETPAVEHLSSLSSKGVIEKEIYVLRRYHADPAEREEELGLHFDLTVPFARYVAQHYNDLVFPFKRYQLQKVWRGERPQKGRFREFYQFDIDIIGRDTLPIACDAEIVSAVDEALGALGIPRHEIRINNRKLLLGIYESFGLDVETRKSVITALDKIQKIGANGVRTELTGPLKISVDLADRILKEASISLSVSQGAKEFERWRSLNELAREGVEDLSRIIELLSPETCTHTIIDMSLARGLDYYTGSIFEISLPDHPDFGTVSAGGRYDDLASQFINRKLPGVGVTLGLSRLMDLVIREGLIAADKKTVTQVLVSVYEESQRVSANKIASRIRKLGASAEVFLGAPKIGKQIEYAVAKGIPYVIFLNSESGSIEIKDLASKEQGAVDNLEQWCRERLL